ncbi:hypothetical protein BH24ACT4_BH24ACT4_18840 [soil metagenome]
MTAYTADLAAPTDTVTRTIGRVEDALDALHAALPEGYARSDRRLPRGPVRRARTLDETVTEVGDRFRAAGSGGGVLTVDDAALGPDLAVLYGAAARSRLAGDVLDSDPSPEEVVLWWASLSEADRTELLEESHDDLGNLDGLPPAVRYDANRRRITDEIERSQAEVDDLQAEVDDRSPWERFGDWVGDHNPGSESDTERLAWLKDRLATLEGLVEDGRQIWLFDPSGDGQVAEVLGDLEAADTVAVVVPGITNDIANYRSLRGNAVNLQRRADEIDPGQTHATIAWLGYNTPNDIPAAASSGPADTGAEALVGDITEVDRINGSARHTIVAHSYGSVVAGHAMTDGIDVDAVAVVGSPGMGPNDRDDLGSPDVDLFAGRHQRDVVPYAPAHGEDPSADGFGATRFDTEVSGHSSYFERGSVSLDNLARIVIGQPVRPG